MRARTASNTPPSRRPPRQPGQRTNARSGRFLNDIILFVLLDTCSTPESSSTGRDPGWQESGIESGDRGRGIMEGAWRRVRGKPTRIHVWHFAGLRSFLASDSSHISTMCGNSCPHLAPIPPRFWQAFAVAVASAMLLACVYTVRRSLADPVHNTSHRLPRSTSFHTSMTPLSISRPPGA